MNICQANFMQYLIVKQGGGAFCFCSLLGKLMTWWMTFYERILVRRISMKLCKASQPQNLFLVCSRKHTDLSKCWAGFNMGRCAGK